MIYLFPVSKRRFDITPIRDFNDRLFLEQLVYLGDISDRKVEFLRSPLTERQLMTGLKQEVKRYMKAFVA
ncbi:hypothetical protein HYV71_01820 [Candidatus Uhrbacteria bacterium]|nr:hypothetical protein [Candidatus Uhrbacteria bacterium]